MRFSTFSVWQDGYQPLHWAKCHAAKVLLQLGADIEARNRVRSRWYPKHEWLKHLQMNRTPFLESVWPWWSKGRWNCLFRRNAMSMLCPSSYEQIAAVFYQNYVGLCRTTRMHFISFRRQMEVSSDEKVSIAERLLSYGVDSDRFDSVRKLSWVFLDLVKSSASRGDVLPCQLAEEKLKDLLKDALVRNLSN